MKQNLLVIMFAILLCNIANSQNVGVGTANPKARLEIKGLSTSDTLFQVKDDGDANRITLLKNGSFGIGTSAPKTRLHVAGGASNISWATAPSDVAIFEHGSDNLGVFLSSPNDKSSFLIFSTLADRVKGYIQYINQDNEMLFVTGGTEKMRILNNGNVGIGATAPGDNLELLSASPTLTIRRSDNTNTSALAFRNVGTNYTSAIQTAAGGATGDLIFRASIGATSIAAITERMRITVNGNVGIGDANPENRLQVNGSGRFGTSANNYVYLGSGATTGNGGLEIFTSGNVGYIRYHDPAVAWRDIALNDAGGNVGIGTAAPSVRLDVNASPASGSYVAYFLNNRNTTSELNNGVVIRAGNGVAAIGSWGSSFLLFQRGNGTTIGSITQNAFSTVAYNTTSDIRLKENIKPTDFGIKDLMKINVKDYNYIDDNQIYTGLLAQELYKIIPTTVHVGGEDEKTNPWGIDYGKLTPHLIKAIQEQQEQIETLKIENTKIAKLEAALKKLESYIYSEAKK